MKKFIIVLVSGIVAFFAQVTMFDLWMMYKLEVLRKVVWITQQTKSLIEMTIIAASIIVMWGVAYYLHCKERHMNANKEEEISKED